MGVICVCVDFCKTAPTLPSDLDDAPLDLMVEVWVRSIVLLHLRRHQQYQNLLSNSGSNLRGDRRILSSDSAASFVLAAGEGEFRER